MTFKTIRISSDRQTLIKGLVSLSTGAAEFYVVQSIATVEPCAERFDTLEEAEAFFMEITLEDLL